MSFGIVEAVTFGLSAAGNKRKNWKDDPQTTKVPFPSKVPRTEAVLFGADFGEEKALETSLKAPLSERERLGIPLYFLLLALSEMEEEVEREGETEPERDDDDGMMDKEKIGIGARLKVLA